MSISDGHAVNTQKRVNAQTRAGLSRRVRGTCVSVDWVNMLAVVNLNGGEISMPMVGDPPVPQWEVEIGYLGNQPICLGPVPRSPLCTVSGSPSSGLVLVTGDDGNKYTVTYPIGLSLTTGDRVVVLWAGSGGGMIVSKPAADPVTHDSNIVPPPIIPPPSRFTRTFNPTWSGSQAGGGSTGSGSFWTTRVYCSDSNIGAYGYGTQIASTIPDGATILSVELYISAAQTSGSNPTIGGHTLASKSGALSVSAAVGVAGGSGWKRLDSLGNSLKTGTLKGFATAHGGYHIWNDAGVNNSGACRISWQT